MTKRLRISLIVIIAAFSALIFSACSSALTPEKLLERGYTTIVTFDCMGGSIGGVATKVFYVKPDSPVIEPKGEIGQLSAVAKEGCFFRGWYRTVVDNGDGSYTYSDKWDFSQKVGDESFTLYAMWDLESYFILVSFGIEIPFPVDVGETMTLEPLKQDGYAFLGYYLDSDFTQRIASLQEFPHPGGGDVYVYARWVEGEMRDVTQPDDLLNINPNTHLNFMNDIDFGGAEWKIACATTPYSGMIFGNGYTLSNVNISSGRSNTNGGLFGQISNGYIENLKIENVTLTVSNTPLSGSNIGILAGRLVGTTEIVNVTVSGEIIVDGRAIVTIDASGLAGYIADTVVIDESCIFNIQQ